MTRPYAQHQAKTTFIRVPPQDWLLVKHGHKTEFRTHDTRQRFDWIKCPTPVVAYAAVGAGYEAALMVLEKVWKEPVGSISEESVRREGFETFADFRRYFKIRTHRAFRPLQDVWCYRLRPWRQGDYAEQGALMLTRLYGEYLP